MTRVASVAFARHAEICSILRLCNIRMRLFQYFGLYDLGFSQVRDTQKLKRRFMASIASNYFHSVLVLGICCEQSPVSCIMAFASCIFAYSMQYNLLLFKSYLIIRIGNVV